MKEKETQQDIINQLTRNKIHIATIQETNIKTSLIYILGNYRIITTSAEKDKKTGVVTGASIMIHGSIQQIITRVARQISRSTKVTIRHQEKREGERGRERGRERVIYRAQS